MKDKRQFSGERIKKEIEAGDLAFEEQRYDQAYHCFGRVAYYLGVNNLKLLSRKYQVLSGDCAKRDKNPYYYAQEAGFAYSLAADQGKLEAHLKDLGYGEKEVHPGTWMAHARFLAEHNQGRYEYGRPVL